MTVLQSSIDWKALKSSDSTPLDLEKSMFLAAKCPNCKKLIRFSMGGHYSEGWGLKTFYCKSCDQTHAIAIHFKTSKSNPVKWVDLTQSLWRAGGVRYLKNLPKKDLRTSWLVNPAQLLGVSSNKIAGWLHFYINIFIKHLESTQRESKLHPVEKESIYLLISRLHHLRNIISLYITEVNDGN